MECVTNGFVIFWAYQARQLLTDRVCDPKYFVRGALVSICHFFRGDNELSSTAPKGKHDGSHAPVWSELFQIDYNPG